MLLSEHKKSNMFKAKTLIEKVGTRYLKQVPWSPKQTIPDHRLYLSVPQTGALITTADNSWLPPLPFHTILKIPQPNIFTLFYTYPCVREYECVDVCVCEFVSVWVCVCVCVCVFVMMSHVDKAWICSAEEFLELYGKVEAVVRNCLLWWSGHLFEVLGTLLFDQYFCFKHISLFMLRKEHFSAGSYYE